MKFVLTYHGAALPVATKSLFPNTYAPYYPLLVGQQRAIRIIIDFSEAQIAEMKEKTPSRHGASPSDSALKIVARYFNAVEPYIELDGWGYSFHRAAPDIKISQEEIEAYFNKMSDRLYTPDRPIS